VFLDLNDLNKATERQLFNSRSSTRCCWLKPS